MANELNMQLGKERVKGQIVMTAAIIYKRWFVMAMLIAIGLGMVLAGVASRNPADVNRDGVVNVLDVQAVVNVFLRGE